MITTQDSRPGNEGRPGALLAGGGVGKSESSGAEPAQRSGLGEVAGPAGEEALARPLTRAAVRLHREVVRMRTAPSRADYCYFTTRTNLEVLESLIAELGTEHPDVVDIGCGPKPFRKLFPSARTYVGIDFAANAAADLVHDLSRPLPLADASADAVLLSEVLEHLRHPELAFREAVRVLRPGGVLFVSTPFAFPIHSRPYDFFRFTEHFFESLADELPIDVVRLEPSNSVLTTPLLLTELLVLHLPKVPFALKRVAWAALNLAASAVEVTAKKWFRSRGRAGRFLRSNPLGYAAGYRKSE